MNDLPAAGVIARWMHFLAIFLAVGAAVVRAGILSPAIRRGELPSQAAALLRNRTVRLGVFGGLLLLGAGIARGYLQLHSLVESGEPITRDLAHYVLTETLWGRGWLAQMVAAILVIAGHLLGTLRTPAATLPALLGASAVVLAAPLTGHATGSAEAGAFGYPLDLLHVLGSSSWIGTLLVLALAGLWTGLGLPQEDRWRLVATLVHRFSPIALVAGAVAMGAGTILAVRYVGWSFDAWTGSSYGRFLLFKIAALVIVAGTGAYNWRVVRPRLGTNIGSQQLRRAVAVELVVAGVLLALTAVLVSLPMPGDEG